MADADNILSGFRESTEDKHTVYKGIIDDNELGQIENEARENVSALKSSYEVI